VVPAPLLGRFYGLFRALSLLAGMLFSFYLMGTAESHFVAVFAGTGVLYCGGFALMCLKVKEGEYPPPEPEAGAPRAGGAIRTYIRECFSLGYYRWVFAAFTLSMLVFYPVNLFCIYYAGSVHMDMGTYGKYVALQYLISFLLSYLLGSLADRLHPLRLGILMLILNAPLTLWAGLFARTSGSFAFAFVAHGVLAGAYFTASASLGQRLFPKAAFAQFFSAATLILNVSTFLLSPALGKLLDLTHSVYRYTFFVSLGLTFLAVAASWVVYRGFIRLGGPDHYQAPEPAGAA